jgi:hypothetical protein
MTIDTAEIRRVLTEWENKNDAGGTAFKAETVLPVVRALLDEIDKGREAQSELEATLRFAERWRTELNEVQAAIREVLRNIHSSGRGYSYAYEISATISTEDYEAMRRIAEGGTHER